MHDDDENDASEYEASLRGPMLSISHLRDYVLQLFQQLIEDRSGLKLETGHMEYKQQFLAIEEVETIIREHSAYEDGAVMAVGGNSMEEAHATMRKLISALLDRVMSNVTRIGVDRGLIDVAFDSERNDFEFSVSKEGEAFVRECEKEWGANPDADSGN